MAGMKYGSVCSGIEAASVAWGPLGWEAQWFSEIEKFPSAVLQHHYPTVDNLGDMTKLHERKEFNERPIDLLVGGTPCQSFSIAGLRKGLDDPRGNLALHFLKLVDAKRPRWVVWENVPGVLSSGGGRDFGSFVGGLAQLGYGWAYRILDAQYFGVPQRRRRVFVVGYLGDWRPASAVLFERQSLSGDNPPGRKAGKGFTHEVIGSLEASGRGVERAGETRGQDPVIAVAKPLSTSNQRMDFETETLITHSLSQRYDSSEDGTGRGTPIVFQQRSPDGTARVSEDGQVPTLDRMGGGQREPCVVLPINTQIATRSESLGEGTGLGIGKDGDPAFTLQSAHSHAVQSGMMVRRLTPRECERLQGFLDDYTLIPYGKKPASDGPRYKALGNSMAVPVMKWIGERIEAVEFLINQQH